jgi:Flp pilus assembly protein TadG
MKHAENQFLRTRRRGAVAVQVVVASTVLLGFAALSVDVGALYNAKGDLQRAVDAAAMAAAGQLSNFEGDTDPMALAMSAAQYSLTQNPVLGQSLTLGSDDVQFGRANYDSESNTYTFTPTMSFPDAVRITLRQTSDSPNGALPLYFAPILGKTHSELSARATAIIVPRDIAIVADLSASHTDDSELGNYENTDINLWDVWDAFPGGIDEEGSLYPEGAWDTDEDGFNPQAAGPAWGFMQQMGYGTNPITSSYDPDADPGLIHLNKRGNWNDSDLLSYLNDMGYNYSERNAIKYNSGESTSHWKLRAAVALGLAKWHSGMPGGLWASEGASPGNGNSYIGGGELEWVEAFGSRSLSQSRDIWLAYIGRMFSTSSAMYSANSDFRYKMGVKTFISYLMESRYQHSDTPELAGAPEQPMQAVKEAVGELVDTILDLDTDDQISLEVYDNIGRHEVDLTDDYQSISDHLNAMQGGHYEPWTNMGGGITRAIEELSSIRARGASRKVMILLTDGYANVNEWGSLGDYSGGTTHAVSQAQAAVNAGIRIFAVSVGSNANTSLMDQIAEMGSGEHFHAEGSIEEYSDQLREIFETLGGRRPVELIE